MARNKADVLEVVVTVVVVESIAEITVVDVVAVTVLVTSAGNTVEVYVVVTGTTVVVVNGIRLLVTGRAVLMIVFTTNRSTSFRHLTDSTYTGG